MGLHRVVVVVVEACVPRAESRPRITTAGTTLSSCWRISAVLRLIRHILYKSRAIALPLGLCKSVAEVNDGVVGVCNGMLF